MDVVPQRRSVVPPLDDLDVARQGLHSRWIGPADRINDPGNALHQIAIAWRRWRHGS